MVKRLYSMPSIPETTTDAPTSLIRDAKLLNKFRKFKMTHFPYSRQHTLLIIPAHSTHPIKLSWTPILIPSYGVSIALVSQKHRPLHQLYSILLPTSSDALTIISVLFRHQHRIMRGMCILVLLPQRRTICFLMRFLRSMKELIRSNDSTRGATYICS